MLLIPVKSWLTPRSKILTSLGSTKGRIDEESEPNLDGVSLVTAKRMINDSRLIGEKIGLPMVFKIR